MKRLLMILIGIVLLSGCANASAEEGTPEKEVTIERKAVETALIDHQEMTGALTLPGKVEANSVSTVTALVSGQLEILNAEVGDFVEAGQVLAQIDDEFVRLQKNQASIGNSLYNLSLESAKRTYERTSAMYETGAITKADYDNVTDMLTKAKLDYAMGQNAMDQIDYQLKNMTIKAPFSGLVSAKYQVVGASVGPGTPVYEVVDIKGVIVEAGVTEKDINRLEKGQQVKVALASAMAEVEGCVEGVGPVPGEDGTYPVRVRIENEDGKIKPGMYAELVIETEAAVSVPAMPKIAVLHENGEDYVFIVEGETVRKAQITKGVSFGDYFEVVDGLESGDQVVVSGQAYLSSGDYVDVVE